MTMTTDDLRKWLERKYHDFALADEPVHGTYGLIWFLTRKSPNSSSETFAVKTIAPEKIVDPKSADDLGNLRREFRMWLELPHTYNVVSALGFDIAYLPTGKQGESVSVPVMRMPRMTGSLENWVGKSSPGMMDRLIALAHAFNGLQYLYDNGFEGHGDLKPSNLLYQDLRERFKLNDGDAWPSNQHPWRILVADLGWADAWTDLGFTNKALRDYLAPERLDGHVVPVKSDMFAMGVIASELLQGSHPAPNRKKVLGSDGKWKRWAESGERSLGGIASDRMRRMIERCLGANPSERPNADECIGEICAELKETCGADIAQTLAAWRQPASGTSLVAPNEQYAWAGTHSIRLGPVETARSLEQITTHLQEIDVLDLETCEQWVPLAESFVSLVESIDGNSLDRQAAVRSNALGCLVSILGKLDPLAIESIPTRDGWFGSVRPFERFSEVVTRMARLTGFRYEVGADVFEQLGPYAKAALAFGTAFDVRANGGKEAEVADLLAAAIKFAPKEPTNYYFRAFWNSGKWILNEVLGKDDAIDLTASVIADLEMAIGLAPSWDEPNRLLESIRER